MERCIVLKRNSEEIRKRIRDAGISVCHCAQFFGTKWLDYHTTLGAYRDVHGLGYDSEEMTGEEQISLFQHETPDAYYCDTVDEFIEMILKCKENENSGNT